MTSNLDGVKGFVLKKRRGIVHTIFDCRDCQRRWEGQETAQALARLHAKKYGHKVQGEVSVAVWYEGVSK